MRHCHGINPVAAGLYFLLTFTSIAHGATGYWSVAVFRILPVILLAIWLRYYHRENKFSELIRSPIGLLLSIYTTLSFISAITSVNRDDSQAALADLLAYLTVFFLASQTIVTQRDIYRTVCLFAILGTLLGSYSIFQHYGVDFVRWHPSIEETGRSFATFGNPNRLAGYLVMIIPAAVLFTFFGRNKILQGLGLSSTVIMAAGLIFTYSRGAMLAITLTLGMALVLGFFKARAYNWFNRRHLVYTASLLTVIGLLIHNQTGSRLLSSWSIKIAEVSVSENARGALDISWNTSEPTYGTVLYQLPNESLYTVKNGSNQLVRDHSVEIGGSNMRADAVFILKAVNQGGVEVFHPPGVTIHPVGARYRVIYNDSKLVSNMGMGQFGRNIWLRFLLWETAIKIARDHPVLGSGLGTYRTAIFNSEPEALKHINVVRRKTSSWAHNDYLQIAAERGVPALVAFLCLIGFTFFSLSKLTGLHSGEESSRYLVAIGLGLSAFLFHSLVDINLHLIPHSVMFWMICGIIAGRTLLVSKSSSKADDRSAGGYMKARSILRRRINKTVICLCLLAALLFQSAPALSEMHRRQAAILLSEGRPKESLHSIEQAITLRPFSPYLFAEKSYLYKTLFDDDQNPLTYLKALESFGYAIENNPFYAPYYMSYASMLLAKPGGANAQELNRAEVLLAKGVVLNPFYWEIHSSLGTVFFMKDDYEAAVEAYRKALEIHPESADTHHNLGNAYLSLGNFEGAIEAFAKEVEYSEPNAGSYVRLATAYLRHGNLPAAINEYHRALQIEPENISAPKNFGQAALDLGKTDVAEKAYRRAIHLDAEDSGVWHNLGVVLYARKSYGEAASCFEKAIALDSDNTISYLNLGNCYAAQGKLGLALEIYEKVRALEPANKVIKDNIARLEEGLKHR